MPYVDEGIQRVAVVQPTGSGKSLLMAKLIEDNPNSRFFVLSTSHKINDQFKAKLDEKILDNLECNIYWNMPNMKQEVMESLQPDYIFLDEMHRALAKEWSKGIMRLLEMYPNAKVLGLSATPIRYLDRCRNVAEELFGGNLACDMSLSQAILDGILPMARYVCGVYSYEKDTESLNKKILHSCNSEEEKKELLKELKILKENLDKGHGVSDIFRKYIIGGNEKLVVFLKDTTHLRIMKPVIEKWFLDAGFSVRMYEVHSKNTDKDKEFQKFKEDTKDGIKLCLSVNMLTEGIHGDIDGVIMLRETISANMYFQMIGRAFACGKKTIPLIFDLVANSQFISDATDISFPNELRSEIEKRKEECEKEGKDYEAGFDVDEFIVMDEFMDVVSGFRAIEGRLIGDWDVMFQEYCKFYEENGHGDVPKTEAYRKLSNWCKTQRRNLKNEEINEDRIKMLEEHGFIWDVYQYRFMNNIKALQQYRDREGDCLVPARHIEIVDGKQIKLGNWCGTIRNSKKGIGHTIITPVMEEQLDQMGFVWDVIKYKFVSNVKAVSEYYKEHGKFPLITKKNEEENKLGLFFANEKSAIRKGGYPKWRIEIIKKYLPEFCFETKSNESFNTFLHYLELYKQEYGHLNIKKEDSINGYNIGGKLNVLNRLFRENKLCEKSVKKIEDLGMSLSFKYKWEKQFQENMAFIKQAVEEGVIINRCNQIYRNKNLYTWLKGTFKKRYKSYKVSIGQLKDIERLIGKSLEEFYNGTRFVKVVDVIENEELGIYNSCVQAIKYIQENFNIDITRSIVDNRLIGKVVSPYKGRFMFYYATDEEVKKYLEDNKVI